MRRFLVLELFLMALMAGGSLAAEAPLTDDPYDWRSPAWSPDGEHIAATVLDETGFYQLCLFSGGAREILWRTAYPSNHYAPVWSPDGRRILYFRFDDESRFYQLYTIHAVGGEERRLTSAKIHHRYPQWSPNGKHIICQAGMPNGIQQILGVRYRTRKEVPLTWGNYNRWSPRFSPDGRGVVFSGEDPENFLLPQIFTYDIYHRTMTQLTDHPGYHFNPKYSPDGAWIVYEEPVGSYRHIFRIDTAGMQEKQLTFDKFQHWEPDVSPDESRIVFRGFPMGGDYYSVPDWLFLIPSSGGVSEPITSTEEWYDRHGPLYAPDGERILFLRKDANPFADNTFGLALFVGLENSGK